jgi:hypothetical protein
MSYQVGDVARLTGEFRDQAGTLVDPSTVAVKIRAPSGTIKTLFYGVDAVERSGLGTYHYNLRLRSSGLWHYRFEATGTIATAAERGLRVEPTQF